MSKLYKKLKSDSGIKHLSRNLRHPNRNLRLTIVEKTLWFLNLIQHQ